VGLELRWLLFDLDGVLVDSRGPITRCLNHALQGEGLAPEPEDRLAGWIGVSLRETFEALLEQRGVDPSRAVACVAHYRERYRSLSLEEARSFPGIPQVLEELARHCRLAVATSKPAVFARPILERLGLLRHFAGIFAPPLEETHREGKTRTVQRALEGLSAQPDATAMIGDRHFDVRAGRAAGLLTVGVTWGIGSAQELRDAGAHHLVASPPALVSLLEAGGGTRPPAALRSPGAGGGDSRWP